MNVQLIPTINVKTQEEFVKQLRAVENLVDTIQIDIADGKFTTWENWHDPEEIIKIKTEAKYELHIMVEDPRKEVACWSKLENIRRIIIHAESHYVPVEKGKRNNLLDAMPTFFAYGWEVGIAINPETSSKILDTLMEHLYYVMIMGVNPGKSGQKFQPESLKKIKKLRQNHPTLNIEVDGGITKKNIGNIIKAGANIICMGSGIFNGHANPKENFAELQSIIENIHRLE